jgi:non-specific serine/threonine protein kinase/serine/threonine-protein kinase
MTDGDNNSQWDQLWAAFHDALEVDESERPEFLNRVCKGDSAQRKQLEKMLAAHQACDQEQLPSLESLLDDGESIGPDKFEPGHQVGLYRIEELIGEGGMGVVYHASQDEPVRRNVALKILQLGMASRDVIVRFNAERQALAMMSHSNISKIFDAGATEDGRPYFVMEYVPGLPVTEYCDSKQLGIDERLRLFINICDGVLHAHQKGVMHRDIKPSNVLVTEENGTPVPKVIDFGIAKAMERPLGDAEPETRIGTLIGTPGYMSPEQAGVVGLDADSRADVYSLGVLLYELLVGVQPFETVTEAQGLFEVQKAIRDEEAPRPSRRLSNIADDELQRISRDRATGLSALRRRLDSDIEWILLKAMEKDRERRYQSVAEFAADIDRYMNGMPVLARAPTRRYRASKFVRRHAFGVSMAALVSLLIIGFAGTMTVQSVRLQQALDQTTLERNRAEQVSDFMVELFESANPEISGTSDVTAREMLDQGSEHLLEELTNQPELRARLLMTVGEAYRVLGGIENAETAISLLENALVDLRSVRPTPPDQLAAVLNALGSVYHDTGNHEDAERNYTQALLALGPEGNARLRSDVLGNLSVLNTDVGNLSAAEEFARSSLDVLAAGAETDDATIARLKQRLAYVLYRRDNLEEAQTLIADTVSILRRSRGESSPAVATALNYAAMIQRGSGDPEAAQQSLIEAADIYRTVYGPDYPYLANTLNNLSLAYNQTADFDKAADAQAEALRVGIASYGADHPNVNSFRINLGTNLQDMGRLIEAEPLLREGLRNDRKQLAPGSPYLVATLDRLGAVLDDLAKHSEAEAFLREAADLRRENKGETDEQTILAKLNLAHNQLARGNVDAANRLAHDVLDTAQAHVERGDTMGRVLAGVAEVRYRQGRLDEARELLERATNMFGPASEKTVLPIARAWLLLAQVHQEAGDTPSAESAYNAAERAFGKLVPRNHPQRLLTAIRRFRLQCEKSKSTSAVAEIRSMRPSLETSLGAHHPWLVEADEAMARCALPVEHASDQGS